MSLKSLFRGNGGRPETSEEALRRARQRMVAEQIAARGIRDTRVLDAMERVPRHRFVAEDQWIVAYEDHPLLIGCGQTISQPYIVGLMTASLELGGDERVLEVGTGSGYQTAILAELAAEVYSIELIPRLAAAAKATLETLGYRNLHLRVGDGSRGWPEESPFDGILVTAAAPEAPAVLIEQLREGGRLVAPVGERAQELELYVRTREGVRRESLGAVRFVPLVQGEGST